MAPTSTGSSKFAGVRVTGEGVDTGEAEFSARPELNGHLATEAFLALARRPGRVVVIDHYPQRRALKAGALLAVAMALSQRWQTAFAARRVGIALPPGMGAFIANLALTLAGRTPVNLNFTAGRSALTACLQKGGIDTVISAPALREKVPDFPWPERTLDLRAELAACGKLTILRWLARIRFSSPRKLAARLRLPDHGGDAEAALLFTSGSAGEPKGVVLTHRNIIGNCLQIQAIDLFPNGATLLGCLPVFHSFGFTVTMWYPLLHGLTVATFPSPLETRKLAEVIQAERVQVMVGAPTFLRPFLKRAEPTQLRSLNLAVAGAEKLPRDLHDAFLERFGLPIREGYGLTETSPVLAVNRPLPVELVGGGKGDGFLFGAVGLLLPGLAARIVDPETQQPRRPTETGVLAVRGCNVFGGYLDDPGATAAVLRDGWFITGDLARFDENGFLFIEGRLSRFSKIGGEMVPHGTVEQRIITAFGLEAAETQPVVVVGVPDEAKGEALIALTTVQLSTADVRDKLSAAGLPNLWIPKRVVHLDRIPQLNTGKLDLRGCRLLAEQQDRTGTP